MRISTVKKQEIIHYIGYDGRAGKSDILIHA